MNGFVIVGLIVFAASRCTSAYRRYPAQPSRLWYLQSAVDLAVLAGFYLLAVTAHGKTSVWQYALAVAVAAAALVPVRFEPSTPVDKAE